MASYFDTTQVNDSLVEAKAFINAHKEDGCVCPCCSRIIKLYKRKLHHSMALTLIRLAKFDNYQYEWIHIRDFLRENNIHDSNDWTRLQHWGFIVQKPKDEDDIVRKTSGMWKLTPDAYLFVRNKIKVKGSIFIDRGEFCGFSEEEILITDAIGDYFNYNELMSGFVSAEPDGSNQLNLPL